ncbi:hypothetical protein G4G29_02180 [Microbacterium sp. Se63.02b]|nr:hypothetical protein G4G29_02180 [Microbacterium sp. Se63.02b]
MAIMMGLCGCSGAKVPPERNPDRSWEEVKASTQAMEREVAALVPDKDVVRVDQNEKGGLFSCDETRHRWTGITTLTLVPGVDIESLLKTLEGQIADALHHRGEFTVSHRSDIFGDYALTAQSKTTGEAVLLGQGDEGTIVIDSWSVCFTLPEGTYPGGDF